MRPELTGQIAFSSGKMGDYDIWTFDVSTGALCQLTAGSAWNDKPGWSPDGNWIAFISDRTGCQEIFKVAAGGGEPIQLTDQNRWCDSPRFSPNGQEIAFVSNESGNNDIWIMDADGQNRRQITRHEGMDNHVEWTSDGRGLIWSSDRDEDADIWCIELSSGRKTQLTDAAGADIDPVISPCGKFVAFVSNRPEEGQARFKDRDKDLWLMNADGSNPVKLTDNQGCDFCTTWSPDGRHILYASDNDRSKCHLRVIDVTDVISAFAGGDDVEIRAAADRLRSEPIEVDRQPLEQEIGAVRHTTFVTQWMPKRWVESCYPPGYFGQERYPHWTTAADVSHRDDSGLVQQAQA